MVRRTRCMSLTGFLGFSSWRCMRCVGELSGDPICDREEREPFGEVLGSNCKSARHDQLSMLPREDHSRQSCRGRSPTARLSLDTIEVPVQPIFGHQLDVRPPFNHHHLAARHMLRPLPSISAVCRNTQSTLRIATLAPFRQTDYDLGSSTYS